MNFIVDGTRRAVSLLLALDRDVLEITALSVSVTAAAVAIAALIGIPIGVAVALGEFKGKRAAVTLLNTLLSFPTVLIGLTVYSFICRRGPFGMLGLLYSPAAIVAGDVILAAPIIAALSLAATRSVDPRARAAAMALGATPLQGALTVLHEARFALLSAIIAATGRVISEVGAAMMLGGNIEGYTRTLTTAISLETSKGDFGLAIALGGILLLAALALNIGLQYFQHQGAR